MADAMVTPQSDLTTTLPAHMLPPPLSLIGYVLQIAEYPDGFDPEAPPTFPEGAIVLLRPDSPDAQVGVVMEEAADGQVRVRYTLHTWDRFNPNSDLIKRLSGHQRVTVVMCNGEVLELPNYFNVPVAPGEAVKVSRDGCKIVGLAKVPQFGSAGCVTRKHDDGRCQVMLNNGRVALVHYGKHPGTKTGTWVVLDPACTMIIDQTQPPDPDRD